MRRFPEIRFSLGSMLAMAALVMVLELRWVVAFLLSGVLHELCHIAVLKLLGCPVEMVSIGICGARIHISDLNRRQTIAASLAGPVGSLLLTLAGRWFPRLAVCALFHGAVNLLPVYPLDGGRALKALLPCRAYVWVQRGIVVVLGILAIKILGWQGIISIIVVLGRHAAEKFLAKKALSGYNIPTINIKRYGYDRIVTTHFTDGAKACPLHRRRI
jgi:Zn-dependent protease